MYSKNGFPKRGYTTHYFHRISEAQKKQKHMKMLYGYKPNILKITSRVGKVRYAVVKPHNLTRIDTISKDPRRELIHTFFTIPFK